MNRLKRVVTNDTVDGPSRTDQQHPFAPRYGHTQVDGRPRGLQTFTPQRVCTKG